MNLNPVIENVFNGDVTCSDSNSARFQVAVPTVMPQESYLSKTKVEY